MNKEQNIRDFVEELLETLIVSDQMASDYFDDLMGEAEMAFDSGKSSEDFVNDLYDNYSDLLEDAEGNPDNIKDIYLQYCNLQEKKENMNFNKIYESNFKDFSKKSNFNKGLPSSPGFPFDGENTETKSAKELPPKKLSRFKYEKARDLLAARGDNEGVTYNARYAKSGSLTESAQGKISPALEECFDIYNQLNEMIKNKIIDKETANQILNESFNKEE